MSSTIVGRTTGQERDESIAANRGGVSFLLVHGATWIAAACLALLLPTKLAALIYLFQGLIAFPASLALERLLGFRTLSSRENSLVDLFVLIAVGQGLALPASIVAYSLDPLYVPVVFAATSGGHFLPYSWLYRTRAYLALALVVALGPFALLVALGPGTSFWLAGFLVGAALLGTAAYLLLTLGRTAGTAVAASRG
jgi:Family of unknown function (DUF7010)